MAKPTLKVTTEFGTFTRQTARTYTHLVIVRGYRAEMREGYRQAEIASQKKEAARYRRVIAAGHDAKDTTTWQREHTAACLAEGKFLAWAESAERRVAQLEAMGKITADGNDGWTLAEAAPVLAWGLAGWCGRLDLARKLADKEARAWREVVILDVATGATVQHLGKAEALMLAEARVMQDASLADPATQAAMALTDDQVNDLVAAAEN